MGSLGGKLRGIRPNRVLSLWGIEHLLFIFLDPNGILLANKMISHFESDKSLGLIPGSP